MLRDFCPPSLVEHLKVDSGLCAFARLLEREYALLLNVAKSPDCALTVAQTPAGEIVGQVTLAPGDEWWGELENLYEVAIEVSSHWPGNILLVRIGKNVDQRTERQFFNHVMQRTDLTAW